MRYGARISLGIAALATCLLAQRPRGWCAPESSYARAHEENVASLRWSLYSLTQLKILDWNLPEIQQIADGSVSCLANIYALRARYVRDCSVSQDVYHGEMAANEKFISLLLSTTSGENFPAMQPLAKRGFFVVGSVSETLKGKSISLDQSIREVITKRRTEPGISRSHPVWIASGLLLGDAPSADEREIGPVNLIPINRELDLASVPYSDSLALLSAGDWKSNLHKLAQYYVVAKQQ